MRNLLGEFGYNLEGPSVLHMDNQSAICVLKNPEHHGRMKHLDLRFYWLRDVVTAGTIIPSHIPTKEMAADIMTKSLAKPRVEACRTMLGLGL